MFLIRPAAAVAALLSITTLASGCDTVPTDDGLDAEPSPALSIEEQGLVDFLADYELSSEDVLDHECGLRSDAARNIDRFRRGPDERYGTDDDRTIDSELTLDSIRQVGPTTIDQVYDCAETLGYIADELDDDDLEDTVDCEQSDCDR